MSAIKMRIETITPALAKKWLADFNYADNRAISKTRVAHYARQISRGLWQLNGESIIFDDKGGMLNGQHRCAAVVQAGKQIRTVVIRGVSAESFTTMDQNYIRTSAQVLKMKEFSYASLRASICRALYVWETSNGNMAKVSRKVSPDEILLAQACYGEEIDEAVLYTKEAKKELPAAMGLIGLAHVLFHRARPRKANEFLKVLSDGLTTEKNHPGLVLRKRFINDKMKDKQMPADAQWCALIRAWNAYDKGQSLRTILVKRDASGNWVRQAIRGLGKTKTGGKIR